jgi:hypothetical protein
MGSVMLGVLAVWLAACTADPDAVDVVDAGEATVDDPAPHVAVPGIRPGAGTIEPPTCTTGTTTDTSLVDTGLVVGETGDTGLPPPEPCGPLVWARSFEANVTDLVALPGNGFAAFGEFTGTVTFGAGDPNETTLTSQLGENLWLATYNTDGTLRWAVAAVGYNFVQAHDLAVGEDGSLAIAGERDDKITFGTTTLDDYDFNDGFVAKYDALGNAVFAASFDGTASDSTEAVAVGPGGEVYAAGKWEDGDLLLPDGTVFTNPPSLSSDDDTWLAKFESDGTFTWARHLTGETRQEPTALAATDTEVAVIGIFGGDLVVQDGSTYNEPAGAFLVQYAADGTWMWDRIDGGPLGGEIPGTLVVHGEDWAASGLSAGGVYGAGEVNETLFPNPISIFNASWDRPTGLLSEAHELIGTAHGGAGHYGGAADPEGRWAIAGTAALDLVTLGPGTDREVTIQAVNFRDPLLATFDADGTFRCNWLLEGDGPETSERAEAVAFDGEGGVIVTGVFPKHLTVAAGTPEAITLTSTTDEGNTFLARFLLEPPVPALADTGDTGP